jgi:hypothetical protein
VRGAEGVSVDFILNIIKNVHRTVFKEKKN